MAKKYFFKNKIIGFDIDGTLIDSIPNHLVSFDFALKNKNLSYSKKKLKQLFSMPSEELFPKLLPGTKQEVITKLVKEKRKKYDSLRPTLKTFKGVKKTLLKLKKENWKIVLLSNTPRKIILKNLKTCNLDLKLFDDIVCSDEVKHSKPALDEFLKAKRDLGHNISLYVGDSISDIEFAKRAKVFPVGVTSGIISRYKLKQSGAKVVLSRIESIFKIIK